MKTTSLPMSQKTTSSTFAGPATTYPHINSNRFAWADLSFRLKAKKQV